MSQKLRSHLVFFLLVITLVILVIPVYAQPGGGNPCPFPPCNPDVPISGIEVLLVAGGVLGVKRILGLVRKSKNQ
jgi:hypothetical protein